MPHSTPFFQGFSSVLFGRPALSGLQEKLREVAALNTLSDFFATFGFLIPDALLRRRSSGSNSRQRRFTLHVTFWAFLAQTLAPETSCRDIVRKVQAWWLLRAPKSKAGSSSTAAYTKARQRLQPATIQGIGEHLIERLEARVQSPRSYGSDGMCGWWMEPPSRCPTRLKTKRNIHNHRPKKLDVDFPRCESSASSRWPVGH